MPGVYKSRRIAGSLLRRLCGRDCGVVRDELPGDFGQDGSEFVVVDDLVVDAFQPAPSGPAAGVGVQPFQVVLIQRVARIVGGRYGADGAVAAAVDGLQLFHLVDTVRGGDAQPARPRFAG